MSTPATISETQAPAPRWLRAWAVLTVAGTAVLLALGGVVTTFQVGMADPVWPTTPWYLPELLFFGSWTEPSRGFLIEHSHRLAGWVVGACTIVLAVGLALQARTRSLKWLGLAALLAVSAQGILGGFRVRLHALAGTDLAAVHGVFAQVVFCLLVVVAALTMSPPAPAGLEERKARALRRLALVLPGLIFVQLVWGALLRHHADPFAQRAHLVTAFAVVAAAVWLGRLAWETPEGRRLLGTHLLILAVLLTVQVALGVEAWLGKFAGVAIPELRKLTIQQAALRTAHMLVGSWILAVAVLGALRVIRISDFGFRNADYGSRTGGSDSAIRNPKSGIRNGVHQLEGTR